MKAAEDLNSLREQFLTRLETTNTCHRVEIPGLSRRQFPQKYFKTTTSSAAKIFDALIKASVGHLDLPPPSFSRKSHPSHLRPSFWTAPELSKYNDFEQLPLGHFKRTLEALSAAKRPRGEPGNTYPAWLFADFLSVFKEIAATALNQEAVKDQAKIQFRYRSTTFSS
jgi:hypothetical protein